MQFKIDPERLEALQEMYEDRKTYELSIDERVKLRRALIEERRDYKISWIDVDDDDVIRGVTDYEEAINLNDFKIEDFSKFNL